MPNETTKPITTRDTVRHGRPVSPGYNGPTPTWTCPACGKTNRTATLEAERPEGVVDACPCGAEANETYEEATR